uniref:Uncharacterized protein n=1 Tax=Castor canadensis TaxID=51338 RepID=A0A8C0WR95_CASCN
VIERWCCILHDPDSVSEEEESQDPWGRRKLRWLRKFAQQEQEVSNFVQDSHSRRRRLLRPDDVSHKQEEGIPGRRAEVGAVDGDLEGRRRDEAPEATFEAGHEKFGKLVLCSCKRRPLIQILQHHADDLHNGQNEGAKGQGPCVVPRSAKGREEREGRQIIWLSQGPVVGGKGPGQGDLTQRQHEVGQPKEHEGIEDLQAQQRTVVARLTTIEGELAAAIGAQARFIGGGETLSRKYATQKRAGGVIQGVGPEFKPQ